MFGVPARLSGREKLKDGRGNAAETSELSEGDRLKDAFTGGVTTGIDSALLLLERVRVGGAGNVGLARTSSSSKVSSGEVRILDERFGKSARGGARVETSYADDLEALLGEVVCPLPARWRLLLDGDVAPAADLAPLSNADGDCSLLAP
jgi:hypothetical protein